MAEIENELTGTDRQPSSTQIRSEIERTRADMDETFDALERKMTPGQILGEAWHLTRGGTSAGASKLWQVAREHPLPSAVIGLGLGWLLVESSRGEERSSYGTSYNPNYNRARGGAGRANWSGRSSLYESSAGYGAYPESYNAHYQESYDASEGGGVSGRVSSAASSVKDAASSAGHKVADVASSAGHKVADAASSAGHKVADVAGTVRERAGELTHEARDKATALGYSTRYQARRAQTGFWQMMEENPLAVGIATLTLGVLAGLSLPATRKENELMGETRDKLVDRIEEVGREALEKGKQVAETAVETIKDEAESAGLTASNLADKVREVGTKAKDAVKEEVQASTGSQGQGSTGSSAGLTTGGVTTPSATTGSATGTSGSSSGRSNTPRETITPVETPELSNKR